MSKPTNRKTGLLLSSCLVAGLLWAGPAQAQDADAEDENAEPIVVTGSRIRGIDPVGSNVIALGAEKIAEEPVTSTA